jgi:hypothetical protein
MFVQPQNEWRSRIQTLEREYKKARGLVHGLQKDAIQNGWGARKKGQLWSFAFELLTDSSGRTLLTMTDGGTWGLTGDIYDDPEAIPDSLPQDQRLARFENMNFSGEQEGPGLYGQGKLLFQAVSSVGAIIYDSLTAGGVYRLGHRFMQGRRLLQYPQVVEGDAAKEHLAKLGNGAIAPLVHVGTRITIIEPLPEVVDAIKDGNFLAYIEETWWEVLLKQKSARISIVVDGKERTARCPSLLEKLANGQLAKDRTYKIENQSIKIKGITCRVKRLNMAALKKPVLEQLLGVSVQRRGMKIGPVDVADVPPDIESAFFGYVELDDNYEALLAEVEDTVHYGFEARSAPYRELKKFVQIHFDLFKKELGYDEDGDQGSEKEKRALETALQRLNEVMKDLGLKGLGQRSRTQRAITVGVANAEFPTEGSKRVEIGETISNIQFSIRNRTNSPRSVRVVEETVRNDKTVVEELLNQKRTIQPDEIYSTAGINVDIASGVYPKFEQVACVCRVEEVDGGKLVASARFQIFVGLPETKEEQAVVVKLESITLPHGEESRRVNYGEQIKDLEFTVENHTAARLPVRIRISNLDAKRDNEEIENLLQEERHIASLGESSVKLPAISIEKEPYETVGQGKVRLRCRVTALKSAGTIEKGDRWTCDVPWWLNRDEPGLGIFADQDSWEGGPKSPRSKVEPLGSNSYKFVLNRTHPDYDLVRDTPAQAEHYFFELMAREALYIALEEDLMAPFDAAGQKITPNQPHAQAVKAYLAVLDRALAAYAKGH